MSELILYACPTGELAAQIEDYLAQSRHRCGPNAAHAYMPHCTLTGFFQVESQAIPSYVEALELSTEKTLAERSEAEIAIQALQFHPHWHGLELASDWLRQLTANFAQQAPLIPTLRLKDWLHLSLAYDFDPDQAPELERLAQLSIDLNSPITWELRLYQRNANNTWHCHRNISI